MLYNGYTIYLNIQTIDVYNRYIMYYTYARVDYSQCDYNWPARVEGGVFLSRLELELKSRHPIR